MFFQKCFGISVHFQVREKNYLVEDNQSEMMTERCKILEWPAQACIMRVSQRRVVYNIYRFYLKKVYETSSAELILYLAMSIILKVVSKYTYRSSSQHFFFYFHILYKPIKGYTHHCAKSIIRS